MDDDEKSIMKQLIDWNLKIQEKFIVLVEKKVISGVDSNERLSNTIRTFLENIGETIGSALARSKEEKDEQDEQTLLARRKEEKDEQGKTKNK